MEEKLDTLYEICDIVFDELNGVVEGLQTDKLSSAHVDYIDKLTHTIKSVKTTIAMMEADTSNYPRKRKAYDSGHEGDSSYYRRGYRG